MKTKLFVVDLDKTLLPYDSFRKICLKFICTLNLTFLKILFLRFIGYYSNKQFKEILCQDIFTVKQNRELVKKIVKKMFIDIRFDLLEKINCDGQNSKLFLLSASPDFYVSLFGKKLKCESRGSYFDNSKFVHMYNEQKVIFLEENFDLNNFDFYCAVSDSFSDYALLSRFKISYQIVNKKNGFYLKKI